MSDPISRALESVPKYDVFMTLEELEDSTSRLAEKYPDLVEVVELGSSRDGRSIRAIRIGSGKNTALLFGCPHPNEPIGTLVLDHLSWRLAEDEELRRELDYTWYVVKVADPDGLKLNEGWLKGPFTPLNYAKNYYRPAGDKQVEWTFPIEYKTLKFDEPLPETRCLMKIIEEAKPDFIYSLHNAGFGGVYFYISQRAPLLYPVYHKIVGDEELPLSLGEPEVPWAVEIAKAVYYMVSTPEYYDYLEKYSDRDPAEVIRSGTDSYDYARRFNPEVFELVTEVPYFYDPRIEDTRPSGVQRRKAVLDSIAESKRHYEALKARYEAVKDRLRLQTRFRESIEYFLSVVPMALEAQEKWARVDPKLEREATVAEAFDSYQVSRFYRLLTLGLFYRMLKAEVEAGSDGAIERQLEDVERELEEKAEELERELEYRVIPVDKLVRVQLAAGLYTALYVKVRNTYK